MAPAGFTLNQILKEIESIYKFKDIAPIGEDMKGRVPALKIP